MIRNIFDFIIEKNNCKNLIVRIIIDHLNILKVQFRKYFISNFNFKKFQTQFSIDIDDINHLLYKT